jgi:hypothetical protein
MTNLTGPAQERLARTSIGCRIRHGGFALYTFRLRPYRGDSAAHAWLSNASVSMTAIVQILDAGNDETLGTLSWPAMAHRAWCLASPDPGSHFAALLQSPPHHSLRARGEGIHRSCVHMQLSTLLPR